MTPLPYAEVKKIDLYVVSTITVIRDLADYEGGRNRRQLMSTGQSGRGRIASVVF